MMMIHCALSAQHIHKYANNDPYVLVGDFNIKPGASLSHPVHPFFLSFFLIFIVTYLVQLLFVWLPLFRFLTLPCLGLPWLALACLALPHHATGCFLMPFYLPNSTVLLNLLTGSSMYRMLTEGEVEADVRTHKGTLLTHTAFCSVIYIALSFHFHCNSHTYVSHSTCHYQPSSVILSHRHEVPSSSSS